MCQLDGNESVEDSDDDSVSNYSSEDEVDNEPVRAVLIPSPGMDGQPPTLTVDETGEVAAPSSLPLTMIANFRSMYNKIKNIKRNLITLGLDFLIGSESWERPRFDLTSLLDSPNYLAISYCRGRETPGIHPAGRKAGKPYPSKIGGGAAILYNKHRFELTDCEVGVPPGIEAVWGVFSPRRLDHQLQRVRRICVASIYIAPRSPFKKETISHIIHTIHLLRARYNNEVHFLLGGDFNRTSIQEVLLSYGALQQMCGVPTRKGASLQLVLTDLHTFMEPPSALPPIQKDDNAKGMDGDHQTLILAPKASKQFVVKREKRQVKTRPLPESQIEAFCLELTKHDWKDILEEKDVNKKVAIFHNYLRHLLDKYFPEKTVTISNLDKFWITPQLKQLLRQVQRERIKHGKGGKFKKMWAKFRRLKRKRIRDFNSDFVTELKTTKPGKWYSMMKRLGGLDQMSHGRLTISSLEGLSDKDCAEAIAQSFASVSQEYRPVDRAQLPAFLPAGRPEEVNVFQVINNIKKLGKTKSTLPIDIPDRLRIECAVDLSEPLADIFNSCLRAGTFPVMWRREWCTPVPKPKDGNLKTCDDVRKVASTSDFSKIFELFLRRWVTEDIGAKIDKKQFAGKKGIGTEHLIVKLLDRVLSLLDKPGMRAVLQASVDWASAFSRTDPTKTVTKMINMGVRPSIVSVLIEFLENRQMSVKFNGQESSLFPLVGGGPQGSWTGQAAYIISSDDNADCVNEEDRFKFCDDLSILELILLADALTEYNFLEHVASDVGVDQRFLSSQGLETQKNLDKIALWTEENLMQLKESKTNYILFTRAKEEFATRLTVNNKLIERQEYVQLLGVWLQPDGGWGKQVRELCKKAYQRMSLLTKLRYAGVSRNELVHNYKQFIRTALEYCSVAMHSSLTEAQSSSLEHCQSVALKVILQEEYLSYESALLVTGLEKLSLRRAARCLAFSLKCIDHEDNKSFFPRNPNIGNFTQVREREEFIVNFARTKRYQQSTIPYCQRLLNNHFRENLAPGGPVAGAGERAGAGPSAGAGAGAGAGKGAGAGAGAGEGAGAGGPGQGLL